MNTKKLTTTALLTALAMLIPYVVIFKVTIPPFTATIGAHLPMFISMYLGPKAAIMVGLGSALGFGMNVGPLVGARAFMHVFVGIIGSLLLKKNVSFNKVIAITAPIHGFLEMFVIMPFVKIDVYQLLVITCVGTIIHHCIDGLISVIILKFLPNNIFADFNLQKQNS